jgi:hypothetical protein
MAGVAMNSALKNVKLILLFAITALVATGCGGNTNGSVLQPLAEGLFAAPPDTVTVVIKGYRPQTGNAFQNNFVSNYSVKVQNGQLYLSSSRDSLSDVVKQSLASQYGFSTSSAESVVTGFADLVLYDLGITTSQQSVMHCSSNLMLSSSNDALIYNDDRVSGSPAQFLGLRDCEKLYLGLNPSLFDTAGNGIPDYLKMHCGLNPSDKNEAYISTSGDGVANIDKCKSNIPLDENAMTQPNQLFAYHYSTQLNTDGSMDLTVSNIPILNGGAENFIALYITETSQSTSAPSLYTAYAVLKNGYAGKTLDIPYWAVSASTLVNQQIAVP